MSYQYVYLIQTREFVNSKEPVYKIGKTTKINFTRFLQYPKGSVQIFQSSCHNCDVLEKNIIKQFHAKYHHCKLIGKEYFKGNVRHMVNDICQLILLEKQDETTESFTHEVVTDIIYDIISNVLDNVPNEIGVEPILPTSEILIEATEVSVELEPTEFCCVQCKYICTRKGNLQKHMKTKKHELNLQDDKNVICKHQCKVCNKKYLSQPGLWAHNQVCKPVTVAVLTQPEVDLHVKIDNLERMILGMANTQQPTTINNSINNDKITTSKNEL